jgi:hypothetical protein
MRNVPFTDFMANYISGPWDIFIITDAFRKVITEVSGILGGQGLEGREYQQQ